MTRFIPVLIAALAGAAMVEVAYFDWNLIPQSIQELAAVLFGAAAGGIGGVAMMLHPEGS